MGNIQRNAVEVPGKSKAAVIVSSLATYRS